jgi:hypothetical protein
MAMQVTNQWGSLLPAGIGNEQQATQATAAFRQSPWYQQWLASQGLQGEGDQFGNVKLSDSQREQLMNLARQHGVGMSESYQIDENGQISKVPSHTLRNIAIGAGVGGLALTGLGAAGIGPLSGLFGAGGGAAGLAGDEAATGGFAGLSAPSSLAELDAAGAVPGLTGEAIPGGFALNSAPAIPSALGMTPSGAAELAGAAASKGSSLAKIASMLKGGGGGQNSTLQDILGAAGKGIGDAETAAGNNRLDQEKLGLEAAAIDEMQRKGALQAIARQSAVENPRVSPFDPVGAPKYSDQYKNTLNQLAGFGQTRLAKPDDALTPSTVQQGTNTEPGTLSKIAQVASPVLSVASKIPWGSIFG